MPLPPDSNNSSSSSVVVARTDIRIRIKVEIPPNVGDESRKQIKGILEKIFEDNSLPFELQHEEVPLSTIENLFYLSTYEITIDPLKRKKVMDITKVFFRKIEALELPPEKYPLLVISSGEAFWPHLIVEHPFVEVSAIMWGNILGGVFLNHWEVSRNRLTNPSTNDIREFINCSFKYDDEEHLVNVTFQCRVKDRDQETLVKYTVTISAAIVQRIIVEQNCTKVNFTDERTRIHFELFCPPFIYRSSVSKKGEEGDNIGFRQRTIKHGRRENQYPKDRLLSGCPYFTLELPNCHSTKLFEIISRLRARTKRSVEFGTFPIKDALIINEPYFRWLQTTLPERPECACNFDRSFQQLLDHCFSLQQYLERTAVTKSYIKVMSKRFTMTYLVEGLLSRGAVVMDQICMSQLEWEKFLELLARHTDNNFGRTERVLEKMLTMLDSKIRLGPFLQVFNGLFRVLEEEENNPLAPTVDLEREGYKRVRKVIITPTRVLYMIPEMMMANRALRLFDKTGTNIVRVSFRDDNMTKMNCNNPGENNIRFSVEAAILKDFKLANIVFGYLGSSNSQLRDHGGYFMQKMSALDIADWRKSREQLPMCGDLPPPEMMVQIETSREQLGKFLELKNVPKMIARMGQCFTQSRESGVVLPLENCGVTFDYVGGANRFGEVYTYSDGAGLISMEFASSVSKQLGLKFVPSCFQVRYRGHKGILVVNPDLDSDNAWVKKNKYRKRDSSKEKVHVAWRDSQNKFHGAMQKELEIVKWASPCPVALNKPLINIMDQVSGLQGIECQQKMSDTIEKLLDKHIRGLGTQLIDEAACRNRLAEMPSLFDYELLSQAAGFELCTEVFFRLLVKCSITFSITKQLYKGQIHVPGKLGRTCFGVPDDSGQLQYGQVFIQISTNVSAKNLSNKSAKEIIKGDVLITKNPCVVPGDIRKFQAVDIPELHHLTDVVVFPIYGPRPHPDEMAGSDLDGDEYCIFWHKGLLIERNEEAFDFSSIKREDDMSKINVFLGVVCHLKVHKDSDFTAKITRNTPHTRQQQEELAKFLIRYMTHDSVGQIATAHLRNADQHGLSHPVCMGLAAKHSQAVDFAKNGILPDKLTVKPSVDEETGIHLPAEAVERVPDFHWAAGKPTYRSSRLLGKLNREIEKIADILRLSEDLDEQIEIKTDPYILVEDWERYAREAKTALRKYNNKLTSYGINSEAEIVSGCIMSMRNKLSDKEDDDMSFFNTSQIVSTIFFEMFSTARKDFFEEFGGWKVATDFVDKPYNDENNICNRRATQPTEAMKQKAVAYYRVCYEAANNSDTKQLSFAWLAYDILSLVKRANIIVDPNYTMIGDPLTQMLSERIDKYVEENKDNFEEFKTFDWVARNSRLPVKCIEQLLNKYCDVYQGLDKFLFIVTDWGKNLQLTAGHFTSSHLSLLSIMFLTNRMSSLDGDALQILTPLSRGEDREQEQFRAIAQPMLKFFEFVASRKMTVTKKINFEDIGIPSFLLSRGEWMDVHQAAIAMYYNMVFNLRIDGLPLSGESLESGRAREMPPFIMEIPDNENFTHSVEDIRKILKRKSGVEELQIRTLKKGRDDPRIKCRLSARGTLTAIAKLKKLTTALYPKYTEGREHRIQELMPRLVLEQIIKEDVVQNDLPL